MVVRRLFVRNCRFSHDKKYLYWQGRELNIESWREFPGEILRTAEKLLRRELWFQSTDVVEPFDPYKLPVDNDSCKDRFGDHIRGHSKTARDTIIKNIGARMREIITVEGGQMKWDPVAVNQ